MIMKYFKFLLLFFILAFVIYQGTRVSSVSLSYSDSIIYFIQSYIHLDYVTLNFLIRKLAHFAEYMVLGFILALTNKKDNKISFSLLIVLIVSILDEFLQGFIGRTSMVYDIVIDGIGGYIGILISAVISRIVSLYYNNENKD